MNPNDLIAQQQALLNQVVQNEQHWAVAIITFRIAFLLIGAWVVYMFYARLRDIADEPRKFRIAFEMADDRLQPSRSLRKPTPDSQGNPFQEGGEERYEPKSS
jgi:hypothetical protein